jgi:uncharacterized membrane protein
MEENQEPMVIKVGVSPWQYILFFVIPILGAVALRWKIDQTEYVWNVTIRIGPLELALAVVVLFIYFITKRLPFLMMGWKSQFRHWQWKKSQR